LRDGVSHDGASRDGHPLSEMHLAGLWLTDFRCYEEAELRFPPGVTVICGANAQGKTSLLEAVGWAATGKSFRGVADSALVRMGAEAAILRAEVVDGARVQLLEAEIRGSGRNRVQLNRHPLQRARDLLGLMRVTVFAPDDLQLVKGGPAGRRDYLDDLLVAISPRYEAARADYERVLKQRNALLRGGMRGDDAVGTLDIFDLQLAGAGAELARGRVKMLDRLVPAVAEAYAELAGARTPITAAYEAEWATAGLDGDLDTALLEAFTARRRAEIERGVTLVGPHRDEWRLLVGGLESRTHASQGEQRTLALALRLGGHRLCTELTGSTPVLLLDDVFSELDDQRAVALVAHLDAGQTLVSTAGTVPHGISADRMLRVDAGRVEEAA
jgi:DNA replication and repair protein RecF